MQYKIGQMVPLDNGRNLTGRELLSPAWYALKVQPQRERATRDALKAKGIHACYPERETAWKIRGKHMTRQYPVVSQIVYAKFTHEPHWDVLKYRRLIMGVFSWGLVPIKIPGDTIRVIMGLPTEAERIEAARRELLAVRVNDQAVLHDGPFAGAVVDVREVKGGVAWFETLTGIKGSARVDRMVRKV
jgi:transcription antitermination factor NusG